MLVDLPTSSQPTTPPTDDLNQIDLDSQSSNLASALLLLNISDSSPLQQPNPDQTTHTSPTSQHTLPHPPLASARSTPGLSYHLKNIHVDYSISFLTPPADMHTTFHDDMPELATIIGQHRLPRHRPLAARVLWNLYDLGEIGEREDEHRSRTAILKAHRTE
jgi:hypothetical protein